MASTYRSHSTLIYASRTNSTVPAPAGIVNGDQLILVQFIGLSGSPPTPTPPSGFLALPNFPSAQMSNGGFNAHTYGWYKVASGESGDYTITHATASSTAFIVAVPGGVTSQPQATVQIGTGTTTTALSVTTVTDGDLVIFVSTDWGDFTNNLVPPTGSTPTFTERLDPTAVTYMATGNLATAGATGNKSITNNSTSTSPWSGALIAIASAVLDQEGFRWRNDDGSESTATWKAAQDTTITLPIETSVRLRALINASGDMPSGQYGLEYRKVGTTPWKKIDTFN